MTSSCTKKLELKQGRMRKQRKWVPEPAAEDRISSLPDEIIHRIMSSTNTKFAVQTCVLSKRWQSLWKSFPYLDFDFRTFPFKWKPWGGDQPEEDPIIMSFNNFIIQVLFRRHHSNLVKVSVNPFFEDKLFVLQGSVERLIAYAVDHNVQQLSILWNREYICELPESFYTCQSLETLYMYGINQLSKFLALPALKSLDLENVEMSQSFFHPSNFSGCPNLETFILRGEDLKLSEDTTLFFNAPNLKRLELSNHGVYDENIRSTFKVVIDAPGLTTFQYCCPTPPILSSSYNLVSIDDAYFDIYYDTDRCPEEILDLINTLKEFRHAKSLTLSLTTVEALAKFPSLLDENRVPFSNLKYLKIGLDRWDWERCMMIDVPGCVLNFFLNDSTTFRYCKTSEGAISGEVTEAFHVCIWAKVIGLQPLDNVCQPLHGNGILLPSPKGHQHCCLKPEFLHHDAVVHVACKGCNSGLGHKVISYGSNRRQRNCF